MPLIEVKIPPMGESITSGVLSRWHIKDGDTVKKDQPLFELETDKITSEGTAEAAGTIALKVAAGAEVKIGEVVASIDSGGGAPAPAASAPAAAPAPAAAAAAPVATGPAAGAQSPAVRRLAAETGIDPATVAGTGKGGRVTKGDLLSPGSPPAAVPNPVPPAAPVASSPPPEVPATPMAAPSAPPAPAPAGERQTRRKMSPLRQRIAQRLVAAQHEAAMLTTFNEVDMSAVMALRAKYQDDFVKKNGVKLGFMSFFTKAVVYALKEVPSVNAQIDGDTLIENNFYDLGMAVSTEKGLMVPVIRNCDSLSMAQIEKTIADAAKRARDGKITLADLEGGVFTITNGGVFGSMLSTPIINPPQSAILGLHAINDRPMAVGGQVVIRPMMYLALSYDHRLVDGRQAVTFLVKVKQAIEDPTRLLLGV
jgi:2-oxoglutarate dehydrogenase E2 component (dihydrolipoamide succinyltransferase)